MRSLTYFLLLTLSVTTPRLSSGRQLPATPLESRAELTREIERKLESTDPRTLTWGAYEAGAYHVTDAVPVLQRILESPPPLESWERSALRDVVLDTLIQLNARLPASLLAGFADVRPVHSLALLVNATDRDPVLLNLLATSSGFRWYAAANMLLEDRAPALAAHLLDAVRLRLTITVTDSDEHSGAGYATGVGVGDGIGQNPRGYPPHAEYRFEPGPRPGFVVLSTGPHPVYYSRIVTTDFQYPTSEVAIDGPTDEDRIVYLEAMRARLEPGPVSGLRAETIESVRWSTPAALLQRVQELRGEIERPYQFLQSSLVRAYGLSSSAMKPPQIEIRLIDKRKDRSVPLPSVSAQRRHPEP